ncbi:AraC family transcriptional regulator [Euhalothece natronophila Z-M001]|uniref:AraC family transcriptional regulator n=1 Tax=Euhalothece natronophila Z-M001 TaxID=522448 RepID=A0A5B8NMY4_9CHRO|nr:helix-turn-helix domain-containing protein [Euhalothece natronophila]QDZ40434.1 AraC family transcriptional regulator [Euhalothece natronophila Z-M001]
MAQPPTEIVKNSESQCFLSNQMIWEHQTGLPSPLLEGQVYRYEGYITNTDQPLYYLGLPRDHIIIVLSFGNTIEFNHLQTKFKSRKYQSVLVGLNTNPLIATLTGTRCCIEVRMHPSIAFRVLEKNPIDLAVGPINLEEIWHTDLCYLTQRLEKSASWQERFDYIDEYLLKKLQTSQRKMRPEIEWAWNQLEAQHGNISIQKLVEQVGWSHRYFNQCFRKYIGITPKLAARRIRFVHAHQLLTENYCDLVTVATTCNYSDQSHLTREFHQFSGFSPATYQNLCLTHPFSVPASLFNQKTNSILINPIVNN